ncbi:unnamed protein product [Notodromas monacha]|uniref:Small ribosomal subunit protein mS25 n=1 Tax=Notodromas monacha TaxID=399045 RepID=A0A7R9GEK0_9CRUS|nr:unnamed protein product [Notodromas monacha]CAG0919705.1 unnamed protein product [Notodromas monacha]
MPFLRGPGPLRRTLKYLEAGKFHLRNQIKVMTVAYNTELKSHEQMREFVFWSFPQLQFKNPDVQIVSLTNLTPTPFIQCFLESGKKVLLDLDGLTAQEIQDRLLRTVCKPKEILDRERIASIKAANPANFGDEFERHCICELPGQVPCPSIVLLPDKMRGKFKYKQDF